jgi:hypothetical protein
LKFRDHWLPREAPYLITIAIIAVGGALLYATNEKASQTITQFDLAATNVSRASLAILAVPYSVLGQLVYDDTAATGRAAPILFEDAVRVAEKSLNELSSLAPDRAPQIVGLKDRLEAMIRNANEPMRIGNQLPGITGGTDLTISDLKQLAGGAGAAQLVAIQAQSLVDDLEKLGIEIVTADRSAETGRESQFDAGILAMVLICLGWVASLRYLNLRPQASEPGEAGRAPWREWPDSWPE